MMKQTQLSVKKSINPSESKRHCNFDVNDEDFEGFTCSFVLKTRLATPQ